MSASNKDESLEMEQVTISLTFGIRGESLIPALVTTGIGIEPSHCFCKGDEYHTVVDIRHDETGIRRINGVRRRAFGVWQLRTSELLSDNLDEHAELLLSRLEPHREAIRNYVNSPDYFVNVRVWVESNSSAVGLGIASERLRRLAALCQEVDISVISRRVHDTIYDEPAQ